MFQINDERTKLLENELKVLNSRGIPFATRFTLNAAVSKTRSIAVGIIERDLTLRNRWTARSIQFERTRSLDIRRQVATIGSTEKYLETQEFGGTKPKKGKEGVAIPTSFSAGQPKDQKPRTKLTRTPNKLLRIKIRKQASDSWI